MKRLSVVLLFITLNAFGLTQEIGSVKCLGGDGPNPLTDITVSKPTGLTVYDLKGPAHEFMIWEKRQMAVYRDQFGKIYFLDLQSGKSLLVASSAASMSRVKDTDERFVSLAGLPVVLDTHQNPMKWHKWHQHRKVKHLYWHRFLGRDSLFSISSRFERRHKQRIEVFSYSQKGIKPHLCDLYSDVGTLYHLGEGHKYPNVFLYQVKKENQFTRLTYYNIQIEGELAGLPVCKLYQSGQYSTLIPGNVKEVFQFPELMTGNQNMFVVRTDHPEKSLLWDDGTYGCRYYNFGTREPIVLNPKQAILAVWDEREGLALIYPRRYEGGEPVILHPLRDVTTGPIHRHHLALSDNGKTLFVLARLKGSQDNEPRKLLRVELP